MARYVVEISIKNSFIHNAMYDPDDLPRARKRTVSCPPGASGESRGEWTSRYDVHIAEPAAVQPSPPPAPQDAPSQPTPAYQQWAQAAPPPSQAAPSQPTPAYQQWAQAAPPPSQAVLSQPTPAYQQWAQAANAPQWRAAQPQCRQEAPQQCCQAPQASRAEPKWRAAQAGQPRSQAAQPRAQTDPQYQAWATPQPAVPAEAPAAHEWWAEAPPPQRNEVAMPRVAAEPEQHAPCGAGADSMTIVMKNIPARCSASDIVSTVEESGFRGHFTYLYLPLKQNGCQNKGYAFVRFEHESQGFDFLTAMSGSFISGRSSEKQLCLEASTITWSYDQLLRELTMHSDLWYKQSWFGPVVCGSW